MQAARCIGETEARRQPRSAVEWTALESADGEPAVASRALARSFRVDAGLRRGAVCAASTKRGGMTVGSALQIIAIVLAVKLVVVVLAVVRSRSRPGR